MLVVMVVVTTRGLPSGRVENWICKAERLDRFAYLVDLALGMSARIAWIGNEISDWTVGHDQTGGRFQSSCFVHSKTPPKARDRRGFAPFKDATSQCRARRARVEPSAARGGCRASRVQVEAGSGFRARRVQVELR